MPQISFWTFGPTEFKDWQENSQLLEIAKCRKVELMKITASLGILNDALSAFSVSLSEVS